MKTNNAYQLHVELEKINTTVDCISDTATANHHIRKSAWIYCIKERICFMNVMHTTCFSIHWAMASSVSLSHWLLYATLQLARADAGLELIGLFFCSYTSWNFMPCLNCSGLVPCRLYQNILIKCIVYKTEVIWLVLNCFRFCNGSNL